MNDEPTGLIYRDAVTVRPQAAFVEDLLANLAAVAAAKGANDGQARTALLRAFLSSAALEGALADAGAREADRVMTASDQIASALLGLDAQVTPADLPGARGSGVERGGWSALAADLATLRASRPLRSSRPEGFAYYGLEPCRFARAAADFLPGTVPVTVVGIRTAGVALSSVTATALSLAGRPSERITVRPIGHPYDRRLPLTEDLRQRLGRAARGGHEFLVVDEGPGLSGSSFLAVGEALLQAGVPAHRVGLFGTRAVDPATLVTPEPLRRWRQFRYGCWSPGQGWLRPGEQDLSGGRWRSLLAQPSPPPPIWPAGERLKALDAEGKVLRKFEGLAGHGAAVHRRAEALAGAGLGPAPLGPPMADGFLRYELVPGRPLSLADRTPERCVQLGRYIAARPRLCPGDDLEPAAPGALAEALSTNVSLVLGRPFVPRGLPGLVRPALADGRLAPHEWILTTAGGLMKVDAVDHGDDHFWPGPTDIAWDLAGAIVEWDLRGDQRALLLETYQRAAGDDPQERLPLYLLAYASFRARLAALAGRAAAQPDTLRWRTLERHYSGFVHREVEAQER